MKKIFIAIFWLISILIAIVLTYENPEKIESLKDNFKKKEIPNIKSVGTNDIFYTANSFKLSSKKIIELKEKVAFISYPTEKKIFNKNKLKIYTQNGFIIENFEQKKLNLPEFFTLQRNGGIKTVITVNEHNIALISGK